MPGKGPWGHIPGGIQGPRGDIHGAVMGHVTTKVGRDYLYLQPVVEVTLKSSADHPAAYVTVLDMAAAQKLGRALLRATRSYKPADRLHRPVGADPQGPAALGVVGNPQAASLYGRLTRNLRCGWIITKDHLAAPGEKSAVGVMGPRESRADPKFLLEHGKAFRLLDDDGEVYYEGRWNGLEGNDADAFGPLHDFGLPNAGATTLQYWDNGWKAL